MRVCIDAQPAVANRTGIGRYVFNLIKAQSLINLDFDLSVFYLDERRRFKDKDVLTKNSRVHLKTIPLLPGAYSYYIWPHFSFPKLDSFIGEHDLYHHTDYCPIPTKKGKKILNLYDLTFKRFPQYVDSYNLKRIENTIYRTLEHSDAIITISDFIKEEISEHLGYPEEKIFTIYPGLERVSDTADESVSENVLSKYASFNGPYILSVSTIEPRKNFQLLIKAFNEIAVRQPQYHLVIVGRIGWLSKPTMQEYENSPYKEKIHILGYVSDKDLPAIYKAANLFIFTSLYEGFGFPPLEAMCNSTPVISSSAASLSEVLSTGAHLFDPNSIRPEELAETIFYFLENEDAREKLIKNGLEVIKKYTCHQTAVETIKIYKKLYNQ